MMSCSKGRGGRGPQKVTFAKKIINAVPNKQMCPSLSKTYHVLCKQCISQYGYVHVHMLAVFCDRLNYNKNTTHFLTI